MDKNIFISEYKNLDQIRENAERKISELRKKYFLENSPFRVGDRVRILADPHAGEVGVIFNFRLETFDWNFGNFYYQVNVMTKEGNAHPKRVLNYHESPANLEMLTKGPNWD